MPATARPGEGSPPHFNKTRDNLPTTAPELEDLHLLLDLADEHDPIIAPVLKLGATTGLRRGELSGLRRDRLNLDRGVLVVETAVNDAGGVVIVKQTKTRHRRTVALDPATVALLRAHLQAMDDVAALVGTNIEPGLPQTGTYLSSGWGCLRCSERGFRVVSWTRYL